jgi:hypothetical protein
MTEASTNSSTAPVLIHADHDTVKHLGNWTTARAFTVRARSATVELDLRSPNISPGEIDISVELDRSLVLLLVPEDAVVDQTGLSWTGRGKVKDSAGAGVSGGRLIRLAGNVTKGEFRVRRGGMAVLSAMASREFVEDARRAHREGTFTTVDDPTRQAPQD